MRRSFTSGRGASVVVAILLAVWPYYSFFQLLRYQHHAEPADPVLWSFRFDLCAALVGLVAIARRLPARSEGSSRLDAAQAAQPSMHFGGGDRRTTTSDECSRSSCCRCTSASAN